MTGTNENRKFIIVSIERFFLDWVKESHYHEEGARTPYEFEQVWKRIYRGKFVKGKEVYFHKFEEVKG